MLIRFIFNSLTLFLVSSVCVYSQSQKALTYFEKALTSMHIDAIQDAKRYAKMAVFESPEYISPYLFLAELYNLSNDKKSVHKYFQKAYEIDPFYSPDISLFLALYSYHTGSYEEARSYIDFYYEYGDRSKSGNIDHSRLKENIYYSCYAVNNPVSFTPVNLGPKINTEFDEYWPSLSADEKTLIFTRTVPAENIRKIPRRDFILFGFGYECEHFYNNCTAVPSGVREDIFISYYNDEDGWSKAFHLPGEVNTAYNEGAACISADGNTIIFTACNRPGNIGECDLYIMLKKEGEWTHPVNMSTVNSRFWDSNPSLSADGRTLYFSSKRPGGFGGKDIWKIKIDKNGNAMTNATNLGRAINTEYNEISPFIHPSNNSLYFASDGHPGLGAHDLFVSHRQQDGKWAKPVNLGYPVNTHGNEKSLTISAKGDLAMFASSRENGQGLDIYGFEPDGIIRPESVSYAEGFITDYYTQEGLKANIELIDLNSNEIAFIQKSHENTGYFFLPLNPNNNYALNIFQDGYLFHSENFSLSGDKTKDEKFYINIELQPVEIGVAVILKNIFFEFDSYELLPESYVELEKLYEFLKENSRIKIEIGGHTDNIGSKEYNKTLSENRARTVHDYLIRKGIKAERLSYYGYYFSEPLTDNETEEGRAKNRRTEFRIMGID